MATTTQNSIAKPQLYRNVITRSRAKVVPDVLGLWHEPSPGNGIGWDAKSESVIFDQSNGSPTVAAMLAGLHGVSLNGSQRIWSTLLSGHPWTKVTGDFWIFARFKTSQPAQVNQTLFSTGANAIGNAGFNVRFDPVESRHEITFSDGVNWTGVDNYSLFKDNSLDDFCTLLIQTDFDNSRFDWWENGLSRSEWSGGQGDLTGLVLPWTNAHNLAVGSRETSSNTLTFRGEIAVAGGAGKITDLDDAAFRFDNRLRGRSFSGYSAAPTADFVKHAVWNSSSTSMRFAIRSDTSVDIQLYDFTDHDRGSLSTSSGLIAPTDGWVQHEFTGLAAATKWHAVFVNTAGKESLKEARVKTQPATATQVWNITGCRNPNERFDNPNIWFGRRAVYEMPDQDADQHVILGDFWYADLGPGGVLSDVADWQTEFDRVFKSHWTDELSLNCSQLTIFDDHDGPGNDLDSTSAAMAPAQVFFRRLFNHTLANGSGPVYYSHSQGGIRFICLDTRSEFTISPPQKISATQMAWFGAQLSACVAAGEIAIIGTPSFIDREEPTAQDWADNHMAQLTELYDLIDSSGMGDACVIIEGDVHLSAHSSGNTDHTYDTAGLLNIPVTAVCAPFTHVSASAPKGTYDGHNAAALGGWAQFAFTDNGATVDLEINVYDDNVLAFGPYNYSLTKPVAPGPSEDVYSDSIERPLLDSDDDPIFYFTGSVPQPPEFSFAYSNQSPNAIRNANPSPISDATIQSFDWFCHGVDTQALSRRTIASDDWTWLEGVHGGSPKLIITGRMDQFMCNYFSVDQFANAHLDFGPSWDLPTVSIYPGVKITNPERRDSGKAFSGSKWKDTLAILEAAGWTFTGQNGVFRFNNDLNETIETAYEFDEIGAKNLRARWNQMDVFSHTWRQRWCEYQAACLADATMSTYLHGIGLLFPKIVNLRSSAQASDGTLPDASGSGLTLLRKWTELGPSGSPSWDYNDSPYGTPSIIDSGTTIAFDRVLGTGLATTIFDAFNVHMDWVLQMKQLMPAGKQIGIILETEGSVWWRNTPTSVFSEYLSEASGLGYTTQQATDLMYDRLMEVVDACDFAILPVGTPEQIDTDLRNLGTPIAEYDTTIHDLL